jgi:hypothetical protein
MFSPKSGTMFHLARENPAIKWSPVGIGWGREDEILKKGKGWKHPSPFFKYSKRRLRQRAKAGALILI